MLAFGPSGSLPLASVSAALVTVTASMTATAAIVFAGSSLAGALTPMTTTATLAFNGTPALYFDQAISTRATITFAGDPTLRVAGKPFLINSLPQRFEVSADLARYDINTIPQQFTVRAKR